MNGMINKTKEKTEICLEKELSYPVLLYNAVIKMKWLLKKHIIVKNGFPHYKVLVKGFLKTSEAMKAIKICHVW